MNQHPKVQDKVSLAAWTEKEVRSAGKHYTPLISRNKVLKQRTLSLTVPHLPRGRSLMSSYSYTQSRPWHLGKYDLVNAVPSFLHPSFNSLAYFPSQDTLGWPMVSEKLYFCVWFSAAAAPLPDCSWTPLWLCNAGLDLTDSSFWTEA